MKRVGKVAVYHFKMLSAAAERSRAFANGQCWLGSLRMNQITMLVVYLQVHYGNLVGMARNDPAVGMGWLAFSMNERIR
jgi:hypothetical protein